MNNNIKLINTDKCNILAVMVPEGATGYTMVGSQVIFDLRHGLNNKRVKLPEGNWQIVGIDSELTEEQCKPLFKHKDGYGLSFKLPKPNNRAGYFTALAAMKALLEVNQCFSVNPYGEKPVNEDFYWGYLSDLEQWQQAQENTGTWLILRKL